GWTRKSYWLFKDRQWDLYSGIQDTKDELSVLKWRYHVRQLQRDLKYFSVTRMMYLPGSDKYNSITENIDKLWIDGIFDEWTQRAVLQFKDAAKAGARFDPIRRELVFPYIDNPTFKGKLDGVVDEETKNEIERWHDYVHNILNIDSVVVEDCSIPSVKLTGLKIVAPMLACSALVKEQGNVNILLACPIKSDNNEITADDIRENLNCFMFLHEPADKNRPFLCDDYVPNKCREDKYTVVEVAEADESFGLFYKGTKNPEVFKTLAQNIDTWYEEEVIYSVTENAENKEIVRRKIWDIYDKKYPGLLEKLGEEGLKLWKVVIKLSGNVKPGFHLLKIKDGNDLKPHPVRVFPSEKEEYKVIHLTDLHIASRYDELFDCLGDSLPHYNNPNDRLREFIEKARHIMPDLIIITGDAVDNANNHRPYDTQKGKHVFKSVVDMDSNWRRLHYILTTEPGIDVPVYISLGNHDFKHNPSSIQHRCKDLNISQEEAENYTYDTVDSNSTGAVSKWRFSKSLGDTLYADENAAQYYFENFCPFTDFSFNIENLNFILMNSGPDKKIFISDYSSAQQWDETWAYVREILSGDAPAPTSQGFGERQLSWLKKVIEDKGNYTNIFCMHSNVINPSVTGLMLKENALQDDLDDDRQTPGEMLVGMGGIIRLEGWGCEDIIDREGWLTESARNKLRNTAGDPPRRWMPMSAGDLEYIREKIKIIDNIIEDLKMGKELNHSELYVLPEEKYPQAMRDSWYPALMEELESLKNKLNSLLEIDYSVSSIDKGRSELLKLFENGSLKIALTGHLHKNMEFRCERKDGRVKWYSGNYSDYDECLDYFNQQGDGLVLSTACSGFLGTEDTYDPKNNEYGKKHEKAWYRMLSISSNGQIRGFKKIPLGDKNDAGLY
ncbi:MAG TPA: metallophosphoesterase, partial [Acetivibrio sp.]|nr:metallophosphoesterase [Acetivibrio sp.]